MLIKTFSLHNILSQTFFVKNKTKQQQTAYHHQHKKLHNYLSKLEPSFIKTKRKDDGFLNFKFGKRNKRQSWHYNFGLPSVQEFTGPDPFSFTVGQEKKLGNTL